MEYDDNTPGFEASESRYAQVRVQRELRGRERANAQRQNPRRRKSPAPREDPYADIPPYENYEDDGCERGDPPRGSLTRVVVTQTLVCAALLGGLFLARETMPNIYRQLKTSYHQVMQTDMSAREVWAAAVHAFRSLRDEIYVVAPYKEAATEPASAPNASAGKPADDAMGGMDIAAAYAESNCAWAPLRTTVRAYPPVEDGHVTSVFGYRAHPVTGEENVHTGLDIAADLGTPIHAVFYGVVAGTGAGREYGNYIILEHAGGLRTLYAHCSEVLAEEGMLLRAGDVIALVGSTGTSTGPHVHIEMRLHGLRCDPGQVAGLIQPTESGEA